VAIVFGDDESAKTVGERLSEQVHKKEIRGRNSRGEAYSVKPAIRLKHVVVRASDSLDQVLDLADQEFFDKPKGEN
jgi:hypothetical protein